MRSLWRVCVRVCVIHTLCLRMTHTHGLYTCMYDPYTHCVYTCILDPNTHCLYTCVYNPYIRHLRCIQRGHLLLGSNAATKVLKYFMVNSSRFQKGYHNRVYFYTSGTIICHLVKKFKLKEYMKRVDKIADGDSATSDGSEFNDDTEDAEAMFSDDDSEDESDKPTEKTTKPVRPSLPAETILRNVRLCIRALRRVYTLCVYVLSWFVYTLCVRIYNQVIYTPFCTYTNTAVRLRELLPTDR